MDAVRFMSFDFVSMLADMVPSDHLVPSDTDWQVSALGRAMASNLYHRIPIVRMLVLRGAPVAEGRPNFVCVHQQCLRHAPA